MFQVIYIRKVFPYLLESQSSQKRFFSFFEGFRTGTFELQVVKKFFEEKEKMCDETTFFFSGSLSFLVVLLLKSVSLTNSLTLLAFL